MTASAGDVTASIKRWCVSGGRRRRDVAAPPHCGPGHCLVDLTAAGQAGRRPLSCQPSGASAYDEPCSDPIGLRSGDRRPLEAPDAARSAAQAGRSICIIISPVPGEWTDSPSHLPDTASCN